MIFTNTISRLFGKFADTNFPKPIQNFINYSYVKLMKLDLSEFDKIQNYHSLNELFTRKLLKKRKFNNNKKVLISPVDSYITECGKLNADKLLQIKGMEYSAKELLSKDVNFLDRVIDGNYINFYLSPKDYHRYHLPCDLEIKKVIHITGKLYPVNLKYLNKKLNLFIENERVIIEALTPNNKVIYLVLVGALNVGKMVVSFEPKIESNINANEVKIYEFNNLNLKKGECFGYFKMGSTIVAIFEKNSINIKDIKNKNIKFAQEIANFN